MFQYFKYFVVILITIYLIKKRKRFGYIAWLILFALLLLDDALQFHETFGTWVSNKLNYSSMLGLRPQDLGELTYVAIFGSILLFFIVFGYMNGDEKYRKRNIDLFLLFGLFLFFGIAMDMVDEFVEYDRYSHLILILLEDGGEMIALSLIVWYFFFLIFNSKNQNVFLFQFLYNKKQSKEESLDEQTKA
jgi:di/tricarboxylate transporter